ncbi:MAG: 50S ribosomal protein L35 [Clostridia bacterium]|nr:50S ribosomal protein L35 [Clostridia bacterium]
MGKIKTHKASAKRFTVSSNGKVKMFHSSHRHNTGNKSAKRLRHLRSSALVQGKMASNIKSLVK